jgi:hypothetical protein
MNKRIIAMLVAVILIMGTPLVVFAFGLEGLDISAQAGGGMAMGTTDDDAKSGKLRWALGGGVAVDVYLFKFGNFSLGPSFGLDYVMLNYYADAEGVPNPAFGMLGPPATTDRTSEARYNYLNIPLTLAGTFDLSDMLSITVRAGGFAGLFLGGVSDLTYDPEINTSTGYLVDVYTDGEVDLDDDNTEQWMWGLRFYVGAELFKKGKLSFTPGLQFDMGLTDATDDDVQPLPSKDTFWALTANVGVKYSVF